MAVPRRLASVAAAALMGCTLFSLPAAALAAAPPLTPALVRQSSFETVDDTSRWQVTPDPAFGLATNAAWGRVWPGWSTTSPSLSYPHGTSGFWAAGTWLTTLSRTGYWNTYLYKYPIRTRGTAVWPLAETDDLYESWIDLAYLMPTKGDADSFTLGWAETMTAGASQTSRYPAKTSGWRRLTYRLSAPVVNPLQDVDLSRLAGVLYLRFYDASEVAGQEPNGTGPIIDDVRLKGFTYGPPRDLIAESDGTTVTLTWTKPAASTSDATPDDRDLGYRVWRAVDGSTVWTELSAARFAEATFTDPSRQDGVTYVYLIQAWDQGTGSRYGVPATFRVTPGGSVSRVAQLSLSAPTITEYNAAFTVTGRLLDDGGIPLTGRDVVVERSYDRVQWVRVATVTPDAAGVFEAGSKAYRATYYRARFTAPEFGETLSVVKRVLPRAWLSAPTAGRLTLTYGRRYAFSGYLRPAHAAGSVPARILAYRLESGKWVYRRSYTTTAYTVSSSTTRYRSVFALPGRGTWRLKAYHPQDSLNATAFSSYTTVKVR